MKELIVKLSRRGDPKNANKVDIEIDHLRFRITPEIDGGIRINKVDHSIHGDHSMNMKPASGNEIILK